MKKLLCVFLVILCMPVFANAEMSVAERHRKVSKFAEGSYKVATGSINLNKRLTRFKHPFLTKSANLASGVCRQLTNGKGTWSRQEKQAILNVSKLSFRDRKLWFDTITYSPQNADKIKQRLKISFEKRDSLFKYLNYIFEKNLTAYNQNRDYLKFANDVIFNLDTFKVVCQDSLQANLFMWSRFKTFEDVDYNSNN